MSSLPQVILRTVQVCGSKIATRFNGHTRTWVEFQERISCLAGGLHGLGLKEGDRAACLALNSDRYMEFYFGVAWAGAGKILKKDLRAVYWEGQDRNVV